MSVARVGVATILLMVGGITAAGAQTAEMAVLVAAIDKANATASERSNLTVAFGDQTTRILLERQSPGRLHVLLQSTARRDETIVIDGDLYRRGGGSWRKAPFAPLGVKAPDLRDFVRSKVTDLREIAVPEGVASIRRFVGRISWPNVTEANTGEVEFSIATPTGLPSRTVIDGTCAGVRCRFEQVFEYPSTVSIEAPTR